MFEVLYRIPPGDQFRAMWGYLTAVQSSAAVAVSSSATNSQQLPFLLLNIAGTLTPGAAQYVTHHAFSLRDPEGSIFPTIGGGTHTSTVAATTTRAGHNLGGLGIIVPPRWGINCTASFNAGAASNSVQVWGLGYYIPRGTLSLP